MLRLQTFVRILVAWSIGFTVLVSAQTLRTKTAVTYPARYAVSRPLSELPIDLSTGVVREMPEPRPSPLASNAVLIPGQPDSVQQQEVLPAVAATKGIDFEGIGAQGWAPSDSNMAVGPNHVVETVNVDVAVYSKSGVLLSGPTYFGTFFAPLGGNCAAGSSDPIVNYDRLADRWIISDIGIASTYTECVGVSKTNDPTGAYTLYAYDFGTSLNDYPKLSVWPTASNGAYLATYNIFAPGGFAGADLCGLDRTKMLAGDPSAAQLCQLTPNNEGSYLPSDLDGPTAPADGTPGLFLSWHSNSPGQLYLRKLTLNFAAGSASLSSATTINVASAGLACVRGGTCIPQAGTTQQLDSLGERLMYRFPVRHFADHDRAMANHTVNSGSQIGVRWYEIYDPAGNVTLNQQGTYVPDAADRWMASVAEDKNADIAIGYSTSSSSLHPAIRFTGRVPSDPAGTMESEISILEGTGSQTSGLSRWGDYTALQVDPTDDCTFWYVDQYQQASGAFDWNTRIGSWAFSACTGGSGSPAISLNPTSLKWGKVTVGLVSGAKKVTLTNTGNATLNITSIATSGDFILKPGSKKTACGSTVAPNASCVVKVAFAPTQSGVRTGNLTFTDNAPDSPQNVALSGTGVGK
jgi:hypothetical protein